MKTNIEISISLKELEGGIRTQISVIGAATPNQIAKVLGKTLASVIPVTDNKQKAMSELHSEFATAYIEEALKANGEEEKA